MIQIEKLSFGYTKNKLLFENLDLTMMPGKIYGLLGKNGAGKTSLIKQMSGLLFPDQGKVSINEICSTQRNPKFLSTFFFVPEEFKLPNISADKFIKIYSPFYQNFNKSLFDSYLETFKLIPNSKIDSMSYGQKKKFLLSFGLACQTPIFIMDEPTNGLDIPSKLIFRNIIDSSVNRDKLFVISTHQVRDIEGLIDSIVVLDNGKIKFNQSIDEVLKKLQFENYPKDKIPEKALYHQEIPGGFKAIIKNPEEVSTKIDMEVLFNAIIYDKLHDVF